MRLDAVTCPSLSAGSTDRVVLLGTESGLAGLAVVGYVVSGVTGPGPAGTGARPQTAMGLVPPSLIAAPSAQLRRRMF